MKALKSFLILSTLVFLSACSATSDIAQVTDTESVEDPITREVEALAMQQVVDLGNALNKIDIVTYAMDDLAVEQIERFSDAWCVSMEFLAQVTYAGVQGDWGERVMVARVTQSENGLFQTELIDPDLENKEIPIEELAETLWDDCVAQ
jgi:hypothetical protein